MVFLTLLFLVYNYCIVFIYICLRASLAAPTFVFYNFTFSCIYFSYCVLHVSTTVELR